MDNFTKKILEFNGVVIFYDEFCGFSRAAIDLLVENKIVFKGYKVNKIKGGIESLFMKLIKTKNLTLFNEKHKTRPVIFYKGQFIGGYNELEQQIEKIKSDQEK